MTGGVHADDDQPVRAVDTDMMSMALPAPEAGVLRHVISEYVVIVAADRAARIDPVR